MPTGCIPALFERAPVLLPQYSLHPPDLCQTPAGPDHARARRTRRLAEAQGQAGAALGGEASARLLFSLPVHASKP